MTVRDDPGGVAFLGMGTGGRPDPEQSTKPGNGTERTGATAGPASYCPDSSIAGGQSDLEWQILDQLDRGIIALDATGTVVATNLDARRVLDTDSALTTRCGRLEFSDVGLQNSLRQLLARISLASGDARGFVAHLHRPNGSPRMRVLVAPARSSANAAIAVLVHIFDTHPERSISHELLCDLYGLTRAQAAVAAHLFEGRSVDQTADALGLSVNTVRSHLKQIFSKCDVHSQGELLHVLDLGPHTL
jgi:DNA-binding CsgD family transcriptional regulator